MKTRNFIRHYVEMVIAMLAGMAVLGMPLAALGTDSTELELLGMAFSMTVPMVAWMRYRGHGWAPAADMTASMFLPSFAAIALLWTGRRREHRHADAHPARRDVSRHARRDAAPPRRVHRPPGHVHA